MATRTQPSPSPAHFNPSVSEFQRATAHLNSQYEITLITDVCIGRSIGEWIDVRGTPVFWVNRTNDHRTVIVVPCASLGGASQTDAHRAALDLAHGVSVATDMPVRVENWWSGIGCRRFPPPRIEHRTLVPHLFDPAHALELGYARRSKEAIAVACFAAARASEDCMSEFLHYYRVLEVVFGKNRDRVGKKMTNQARAAWVNATAQWLAKHYHCRRVDELAAAGVTNVDEYLYETNRCAIAHAADLTTVADPSDPEDIRRVASDVQIMRPLARKALIDHLPTAGCSRV